MQNMCCMLKFERVRRMSAQCMQDKRDACVNTVGTHAARNSEAYIDVVCVQHTFIMLLCMAVTRMAVTLVHILYSNK